ncbi:MAG: sensor domain-containing diguanylate cyclase [Candidatus Aquicultor sp.]
MDPNKFDGTTRLLSVKGRLFVLLVVMLLPFIIFSTYKALDINKRLEEETKTESLKLAQNVAHDIDEYIISTGEALIPIAENENVRAQNYPKVRALLQTIVPKYPFYNVILFVDNDGNIRAAAASGAMTNSEDAKKVNVRDTVCYVRSIRSDGMAVGDFIYSRLTGIPVVHVTYPVHDFAGKRIGFIAAAFDLTKIQNKLMQTRISQGTVISVLDDKGVVIARSADAKSWVGKNLSHETFYTSMLGKTSGTSKLKQPDGITRISGFTIASKVPWFVRVCVDERFIQKEVTRELTNHFALFVPLLLVALLGWLWIGRDVNRLHKMTERLSLIDPLTELWNYRKLSQNLEQELIRARRYKEPLSFIMIDIDYFKHYNDNNGHQLGDETLRTVAMAIRSAVRDTDHVYRYGGEEMCAVLPNTGQEGAAVVAERIRTKVEQTSFQGEAKQPAGKLTVSLGVATYPFHSISKNGLIHSADVALYKAKENGRNRVETCCTDGTSYEPKAASC